MRVVPHFYVPFYLDQPFVYISGPIIGSKRRDLFVASSGHGRLFTRSIIKTHKLVKYCLVRMIAVSETGVPQD